jgi:transcriptional regulator with XRE-family HTH domain
MSSKIIHMETVGQIIRAKRESLGLLLRQVASHLDIDQAILSKIERNERKPTKDNIIKLAEILKLDKEDLLVQFMSEKIAYEIVDEDYAGKVLKAAEQKVKYLKSNLVKN